MSVLSRPVILRRLKQGRDGDGLVITPLRIDQIGPASVDLSLGNEFIAFKRASVTSIDIMNMPEDHNVHRSQEKKRIGSEGKFVLHPGQLVLGATREYIALPEDISADIVGRSTWGRTGLIIATATYIQPGFKGCVTLELLNEGEIPLVLYPGLRVAQLVLSRTEEACASNSRYQYQTGPEFPRLGDERRTVVGPRGRYGR